MRKLINMDYAKGLVVETHGVRREIIGVVKAVRDMSTLRLSYICGGKSFPDEAVIDVIPFIFERTFRSPETKTKITLGT